MVVHTGLQKRDLEAIDNVVYQAEQAELIARTVIPLKTDVDPAAETYGYDVMKASGAAKVIANDTTDIPLVDVDVHREQQPIYTIAMGFGYTIQELRQANFARKPVDTTKAAAARRAVAEKENQIAFIGDKETGIPSLTNAEGIQTMVSTKKFKEATSEEIVETFRQARKKITVIPTYGMAQPMVLVTPDAYEELNKRYGEYDSRTIMAVIKDNGWFANILPLADLAGIGDTGTDSMVMYVADPKNIQLLIPEDITRMEQEYTYPRYKVPLEERTGGNIIRTPYTIVRVDGI